MSTPAGVVFDTDVLVGASLHDVGTWRRWPSIPPISPSRYADCLGIVGDPFIDDWALWLSFGLLELAASDLADPSRHGWDHRMVERYVQRLVEVATDSGGGILTAHKVLGPKAPDRVRAVWGTAVGARAVLIVSDDDRTHRHSPWPVTKGGYASYGTHAVRADLFRTRVDAARRVR
ncbi:MAG TPA: hypothetical protein ENH00_12250 [Actinobacteria bacterium]|nr:hypothetical protein BMS3Bbin01_01943 [bacterium BMS3Bbin01]HDH26943.1 hypothetical protein [Actinomycetota bacterium]